MPYTLDDLADQLEEFEPSTLVSIVLVQLGARPATLIEHAFGYLRNSVEYEIKHTKYPESFLKHKKWVENSGVIPEDDYEAWDIYLEEYRKFSMDNRDEIDRLFVKRVKSLLKKFYPELHMVKVIQGILVTREPVDKTTVRFLRDSKNPIGEKMGELIGYPCHKSWGKKGYHKSYNLNLNISFPTSERIHIFGNTFCNEKNLADFKKLAKKYERVLKTKDNVFRRIVKSVEVESEHRNLDDYAGHSLH